MSRSSLVLSILLTVLAGPVSARQRPYTDPALRALLRPAARAAMSRAAAGGGEPGPLPFSAAIAVSSPGAGSVPRIGVLLRLRPPVAEGLARLRRAGAEIGTVAGDIVTARVPLDALDPLAGAAEIARIDAARVLEYVNDLGIEAIRAHEVRQRTGHLWLGAAGHGVIVGIYDTGIDYDHEDFLDGSGRSRLLGIWDQTAIGTPPAGFRYGSFCDRASLESGSCAETDGVGHGTHVAGTAAGDGSAAGNDGTAYQYAGVAPAADLLVVKGGDTGFETNRIVDGVSWIFQVADSLGRPAVVNLSLGGPFGPHDGTTLFELGLDSLAGPGHVVVASAGNAGSNANTAPASTSRLIHAMAAPGAGSSADFQVEIPAYAPNRRPCNDFVLAEIWYQGADRFELSVVSPDGSVLTAAHGDTAVSDSELGEVYIDNAALGADPDNGDFPAFVQISDCGELGVPRPGTWTVRATATTAGSGEPIHLWLASDLGGASSAHGISANFTNSHVVSTPATAREVLAAGAFVTRLCWNSSLGQQFCFIDREAVGDVARFSAGGPTRDGRLKPEIAAPGMAVISALSGDAATDPALIATDGSHAVNQGTSMAAPHVTGTVALLLQRDPTLTAADIRGVFARTAAQDAFTANTYTGEPAGTPNNQWGYGKLDAKAALDDLGALPPATLLVEADALPRVGVAVSEAGTRFPLLRVRTRVAGTEPMRLLGLGIEVSGQDPEAELLLVHDLDQDATADPGEPVLAREATALAADAPTSVRLEPRALDLAPADSAALLVLLEISGKVPNGTEFAASYDPEALLAIGLRSGTSQVEQPTGAVAAAPVRTTVLFADEIFALSENPVRSDHVIFNFRERPTLAGVYSLGGARIANLLARMSGDGRVEWDLTNDRGSPVAAGVYLVVFDIAGELVRRKLFVVRPAPGGGKE